MLVFDSTANLRHLHSYHLSLELKSVKKDVGALKLAKQSEASGNNSTSEATKRQVLTSMEAITTKCFESLEKEVGALKLAEQNEASGNNSTLDRQLNARS